MPCQSSRGKGTPGPANITRHCLDLSVSVCHVYAIWKVNRLEHDYRTETNGLLFQTTHILLATFPPSISPSLNRDHFLFVELALLRTLHQL